eukprot:scaffold11914_cov37-Attheya_sp.AAC.2
MRRQTQPRQWKRNPPASKQERTNKRQSCDLPLTNSYSSMEEGRTARTHNQREYTWMCQMHRNSAPFSRPHSRNSQGKCMYSIYHPTSFNQEKRAEFLNTVDNLYEQLDTDNHILISGCNINRAIEIRKSSHCHPDGRIEDQVDNEDIIGPHGIDHMNEPGV